MTTALDSSVLWAIILREPGHEHWLHTLMQAASEGPLIISPVVFAELAPSTANEGELLALLARLAIIYDPITPASAHVAGLTFKRYRKAGGPRQHLVPDFLI
ncbi:MAG: DNA-binding protein, partial [Verrucomicrobiaceae bacterium]|nr:DNA-binding protein [Verrucomicrobiaceae bacterium]